MEIFKTYEGLSFVGELCGRIALVAFGVLVLCVVAILVKRRCGDWEKKRSAMLVTLVTVLVMGLSCWGSVSAKNGARARLSDYVSSGWAVYINGEEVDYEKIDMRQYEASVDEKQEVVYLAQKRRRQMVFVPIVYC